MNSTIAAKDVRENASTSITVDVYVESADLSLIYREIYALAIETCHLPREKADALACWYCATGGHVELTACDFNGTGQEDRS